MRGVSLARIFILVLLAVADTPASGADTAAVRFQWSTSIPLRDGVRLHASIYSPSNTQAPTPCVFTLTPYTTQSYHDRGVYFASHGLTYLVVDSRGRGGSEGEFKPFIQE